MRNVPPGIRIMFERGAPGICAQSGRVAARSASIMHPFLHSGSASQDVAAVGIEFVSLPEAHFSTGGRDHVLTWIKIGTRRVDTSAGAPRGPLWVPKRPTARARPHGRSRERSGSNWRRLL